MPVAWERQRVAFKRRGRLRGLRLTSFTSYPVCPGSSLQDLYIFCFFCSSFSSFFPSKLKNSLAIRKKKIKPLQAANMRLHKILLVKKQFYKKLWHIGLGEVLPSPFRAPLTATSDLCTASFSEWGYLWFMLKGLERVETWDHRFWGPTNCSPPANTRYF